MSVANTPTDIVRTFVSALDDNDIETASSYLDDTFVFSGWTPKPVNKRGFIDIIGGLKEGMPGLNFNLHNVLEQNEVITGTFQIAGYQTDSFIIPTLGIPPIPQMASSVSLPAENVTFTLNNKRISGMQVQHVEGGGIQGLIRQLGADVTIVQ